MRNEEGVERVGVDAVHRQAHAVDADRAFARHIARELAGHAHLEEALGESQDVPDTVDVPGDQVAAEPLAERERLLEVDGSAGAREPHRDA